MCKVHCVDTPKNFYKYANNYVNMQHNVSRLMSPVHANYLTFMQTPHARLQFLKTVIVTELYNDNVQLATFKSHFDFRLEIMILGLL